MVGAAEPSATGARILRPALDDNAAPFDMAAPTYDATFTHTRLGGWLRARVWEVLAATFAPGDRILEIGCGTGEDAAWLARRGMSVVATDASRGMLSVAEARIRAAGLSERVEFSGAPSGTFDGALSDFGAVNCVADRAALARDLAERVRPGGRIVLVVMGPACAWEIGWHMLRGRPRVAFRRFSTYVVASLPGGGRQRVWYPSPATLRREMSPWFVSRSLVGVGVALPPSYLAGPVEGWPAWTERLDRVLSRFAPFAWVADHYLAVFERR